VHGPTTLGDEVITGRVPWLSASAVPKGLQSPAQATRRRALHPNCKGGALQKASVARGKSSRPPQPEAAPCLVWAQMAEARHAAHPNFSSAAAPATRGRDLGDPAWVSEAGSKAVIDRRLTPSWPRLRRWRRGPQPTRSGGGLLTPRGVRRLEGTDRGLSAGVRSRWCLPPETLAAGINMPAREPTVISALSKRTERGTAADGQVEVPARWRAGSGGVATNVQGYVVTCAERFEGVRGSRHAWPPRPADPLR